MGKQLEAEGKQHMDLSRSLAIIDRKIDSLSYTATVNRSEIKRLQDQREEIVGKLDRLTPGRITVTDHALVRYMERVLGIDLEEVRTKMFTDAQRQIVSTLNSCILPIGEGQAAVLKNRVVVTILPERKNSSRLTRAPKSNNFKKRQQALERGE